MSGIRIVSLYSGSTGNAFLVDGGSPDSKFLIDAGKNTKKLCLALEQAGVSPKELQAIFITHEHSDHVSALPVLLKKYPMPVHLASASAYKLANDPAVAPLLCLHSPIFTQRVGNVTVSSFPTPHDSRCSVGYRLEFDLPTGECVRIGYATDIGHASEEVEKALLGCEAVVLESNHDVEMLRMGSYPYDLKQRILSKRGHLCNNDSAVLAARLAAAGTKTLLLAHLSQENNTPELAYEACFCAVGDENVRILVAHPDEITEVSL